MARLGKEERDTKIKLARQMRMDDVAWSTISADPRIDVGVPTLKAWLEDGGSDAGKPAKGKPAKGKRGNGKVSDAVLLKEQRAENARLQALVSDLLLGKLKVQKS